MNTDEQYGECFNPEHITNCNGSYKDCATPSDPVEELVSELMLKVSGIIKKHGNPTVHPPEMNKELDAAYYEAKAKINRLLVEARLQLKLNVWQQFKDTLDRQELSARPPEGARFRTPLEELTLILEREVPLSELNNQLKEGGEK